MSEFLETEAIQDKDKLKQSIKKISTSFITNRQNSN